MDFVTNQIEKLQPILIEKHKMRQGQQQLIGICLVQLTLLLMLKIEQKSQTFHVQNGHVTPLLKILQNQK
jgi:hypothetical protein